MKLARIVLSIVVALGTATCAQAQNITNSRVVTTCATQSYAAGTNAPNTQNLAGAACVNATVSASVAVAPLTSTNLAGTIATTDTFQSIQVSTAGRNGCLIQNQSTSDAMYVFFGAIGSATKAKSFVLDSTHGLAISCAVGGLGVLTDQVSITGTTTDLFTANFQ